MGAAAPDAFAGAADASADGAVEPGGEEAAAVAGVRVHDVEDLPGRPAERQAVGVGVGVGVPPPGKFGSCNTVPSKPEIQTFREVVAKILLREYWLGNGE